MFLYKYLTHEILFLTMDIEYGKSVLSEYRKLYKKYSKKIWFLAVFFTVVTLAIIVEKSFRSIEKSVENNSGVSFTEDPPEPLNFDETSMIPILPEKNVVYRDFVLKTSPLNKMLQKHSLNMLHNKTMNILIKNQWDCVHLRHFGLNYDILVFKSKNITVVNPEIIHISDEMQVKHELGLDNTRRVVKRPISISLNFIDKDLETQKNLTLSGNDAACLSYYKNIK